MKKITKIIVNRDFVKGKIDRRIYGSFVEHMGRVVYTGIYEPSHPAADKEGFRQDVTEKISAMGVSLLRYPGGNFVSNYDWRDGIGPRESRPKRLEIAWKSIETNEVGTDEFMKWVSRAGIEPVFAVNLGTKGMDNALSLLEYCNIAGGTYYSDLRRKYGSEAPYGIKTWCLGNEMDGAWQVGHKTAQEYGRLAAETAKAMKMVDDTISIVVCGSSKSSMATFPEWEAEVLNDTYEYADYLALHQYYGGQEKGTAEFLSQSLDMENYIRTVCGTCDYIKAVKRSAKNMMISIDEWGVWSIPDNIVADQVSNHEWKIAPAFSEQIYSMEDTLLFASMMMNFIRYSDRIKIACQSLLTNISAAIMTEKGGGCWVQPIYYVFMYMARYGKGVTLRDIENGETYSSSNGEVPYVDETVVYNEAENELVVFAVNRTDEVQRVSVELQKFTDTVPIEHVFMLSHDIKATNYVRHDNIVPQKDNDVHMEDESVECSLQPYSWNMIRLKVQ